MKYTALKEGDKKKYGTNETGEPSVDVTNNDKEKLLAEEKGDGDGAASTPKAAGFFDLFRYATCLDRLYILIGSVFAICQGLGWPAIFLIFGGMTDSFTAPEIQVNDTKYNATQAYLEKFQTDMNQFTLLYVYIACAIFVACYFQISFWGMVGERVVHKMRMKYFQSIMRQDMGWFDAHSSGELTTRLADDFNKVKDGVGDKFSLVLQSLATFIGGFVIGFVISWRLTLVMMAMTPLLAICGGMMSKAISSYSTKEQEKYAVAGSVAEEVLSCIRTVVSFRGQRKEVARYGTKLDESLALGIKKALVTGISFGLNMLIIHATYAIAYWYGSTLVVSGILSAGQVFTVFLCVILGAVTLGNVGTNIAAVAVAKGGAGAVLEVIDREPVIDAGRDAGDILDFVKGTIEFLDVQFRYPTRPDVLVLDNLKLTITPGQTVALVGSSGCGKSTTVSLIQRFYDPVEGQVLIDGNDIKSLNIKWLREQIGVVSQEPVLFDCSISENIRYGRLDVTQAEIEDAARAANAHDFISKLPDGYETVVGERGGQMSGGQKQRIAIARALVRDPKILLLDEATSALDSESEGIVQAALDKASEGRTTVIVAHRLSTVQNADVIYVFKDGAIAEQGRHSTLMAIEGGIYRELVTLQTLAAEEDAKAMVIDEEAVFDDQGSAGTTPERKGSLKRRRSSRSSFGEFDRKKMAEVNEVGDDVAFREIFALNKPEMGYIVGGCLASVVVGASMPVFAVFFSELVRVFGEPLDKLKDDAVFWSLMFLVLGAAVGLGNFFMQFFLGVSGEKLTTRLRKKTFESILGQDISWFDDSNHSTGALTSRLATDASMVRQATGIRVGTVVQSASGIITGLCIALVFGWKLALAILAATPLCALSGAIQNKVQHGGQKKDNELLALAGKVASEAIENVKTVQSLTREALFYNSYCDHLSRPFKEALKTCHIYGLSFAFSQAIIFFLYAGAFRFGAYLVYTGDMTPPNVFRVFFAIAFAGIAMGQAASLLPDYSKAKLSAAHVMRIVKTIPKIDSYTLSGKVLDYVAGDIVFKDVKFAYPNRPDIEILKGLNLTIKPGQTVALVGGSGSGKSTTVSLIQRFYDPNRGTVFLDGEDITQMNVTWLRSKIGVVSQEPVLFDCSIRENIAYGVDEIPDYDIIDAARTANIHDFIEDLPAGYDTQVGEKGTQLSGGQKQRIAIARALVCNPKILLLDEATSALDTESEKIVQVALDKARAGRTCLIIAHRLSTIQNADSIAVVENGVIVEQGTHQALLAKKGSYYNLSNGQRRLS